MESSTYERLAPTPTSGVAGRIDGAFNFLLSVVSAMWIFAIMALVCADIAMRNIFNAPISGVAEFIALSVPACVFLQLPSAISQWRLVRAELVIGALERHSPRAAAVFNLVFALVGLLIFWKIIAWAWPDFMRAWQSGQYAGAQGAYEIPVWPFKLTLLVGSAFGLVQFARHVVAQAIIVAGFDGRGHAAAGEPPAAGTATNSTGWIVVALFLAGIAAYVAFLFTSDMAPVQVGIWSIAALLVLVVLGMPIPLVLMAVAYLGIWVIRGTEIMAINLLGLSASTGVGSYEFGVIPLFVMMGLVLEKADVGRDAFQAAAGLLRRLRGGLGMATVGANAIFASIVGSSIASAAVFSRIAVPELVKNGYTRRFAVGTVAGSSVLGMLIPPSLLLIVYGLVAEVSVGHLFIAAIIPGIILAVAFALAIYGMAYAAPRFVGDARPSEDIVALSWREIAGKLLPIVILVVTVVGGIYGGLFTPTEAAAVGAAFAFVIALLKRRLGWTEFRGIVLETSFVSAAILFLIVAASLYTRQVALTGIPMLVSSWVQTAGLDMTMFLAVYFVIVLLLGMVLDSVSIMLIVLPIMLPVVEALGGDKIWFGIVTTVAIEIGLLTPPFGLSVYVVKGILPNGFVSLSDIFIGVLPFVLVMILVTILLMAVPQLSLFLLR